MRCPGLSPAVIEEKEERDGHELSDLLEIHIVELKKRLEGDKQLDDWIRLLNART